MNDDLPQKLLSMLENSNRLERLNNQELVKECLSTHAADYDVVVEMMNRLDPNWSKEIHPEAECACGHLKSQHDENGCNARPNRLLLNRCKCGEFKTKTTNDAILAKGKE